MLTPAIKPVASDPVERLQRSQVDGVYEHVARAAIISSVLAVALAVYLTPSFGASQTNGWLALKLGVSTLRLVMAVTYKRTNGFDGGSRLAQRLMLSALVADGAVWGFAGVWGVAGQSEIACLMVACLASVALMATHGLGSDVRATAAYVVPMLLPVVIAMPFRGDSLGLFGAAGTALVLVQSITTGLSSERRLHREVKSHDALENALAERSTALAMADATAADLQRALVELKKQGAIKSLFLGTISHELRTPLHGILGLTQLVLQQTAEPVSRHRLELVESSGNHLLELIGGLLDVSRMEAGRLELHEAPFDLLAELEQLTEIYDLRCAKKGIEFRSIVNVGPSCRVIGDAARLRQVLHNLLGNAVKFTAQGAIAFKVGRAGERYSFDIADTGPGIAAEDLPRIFEPFGQVDESATRPTDGTGLGLTIAREIAHLMKGEIAANSALGVGSRFTFTASLTPGPEQAITQPAPSVSLPRLVPGFRVLLVEDNDVNALIAQAHLEQLGAHVIRAHDGQEAISLAFKPRPDFILMDCRMPVMDGPTATRKIRLVEGNAGTPRIPIVALTASPTDETRRECYEAGMDGILTKPYTDMQLLQTIALYSDSGIGSAQHPLYEFAMSLDDMEPDLYGGLATH